MSRHHGAVRRTGIVRAMTTAPRLRATLLATVAAAAIATLAQAADTESAGFHGTIARISPAEARLMTGVSWRPGCPVPLSGLRMIRATHHGFDGRDHEVRIVVNKDVASSVLAVLSRLYADGFPIRRMVPVDAYRGNDERSIEADNTSAFRGSKNAPSLHVVCACNSARGGSMRCLTGFDRPDLHPGVGRKVDA